MYVKLFSSILASSIWSEDVHTRVVWITLLALADRDGFVRGVPSGLARQANVPTEACRNALKVLGEPDLESQSQEWGGRRIEAVEGGWLILNYVKYRDIKDLDTVRAQTRDRVRRHRKKKRTVTAGNAAQRHTDTDTDAEANTETTRRARSTWLTPYTECHIAVFPGSTAPVGPMLKTLRPLDEQHGPARVAPALRRYLEDLRDTGRAGFLSYPQFAATFSQWEKPIPSRNGKRRPTAVTDKDYDQ